MKRKTIMWVVAMAWLVPTIVMGAASAWAPNVVTQEADAGSFVRAELRPGGYFAPSVMTVHTTRGTLAVADFFSALRGTPLVVVDSTGYGLQVCNKADLTVCSNLLGLYVGPLTPVPHARIWLTYNARGWLGLLFLFWGVLGMAAFLLTLVVTDDTLDDDGNHADGVSP